MSGNPRLPFVAAAVAVLILAAAPFVLGAYPRYLIVIWLIYSLSAVGLNLPIGLGQIYSLGHGGFMLVGAYATAIAISKWGWPYPLALLLSVVLAVAIGVLVGLPALRLRLFSLAIVTFGFGYTLFHVVKAFNFTGGPQGLFMDPLWLQQVWDGRLLYLVVLLLTVLGLLASYSISTSKSGRALRMLGENETAARSLGIHPVTYKLAAFAFASVLAAVAGNLHATVTSYVAPETYAAELSITMFAAVMIGGKGRLLGPFLGSAFIVAIPELTQAAQGLGEILYAVLFIIVVTLSPEGLLGLLEDLARRVGLRSPARRAAVKP